MAWELLGTSTASGTVTALDVSSIPAKNFLLIEINLQTGSSPIEIRFNDSGTAQEYCHRRIFNGASSGTGTDLTYLLSALGGNDEDKMLIMQVMNLDGEEKVCVSEAVSNGAQDSAGTYPDRHEHSSIWWNNDQVNKVELSLYSGGTANILANSYINVYGTD
tara:strand:+ start:29 stop:514 length:486 start_codon:yes stop_codon:yes gene_type:complete